MAGIASRFRNMFGPPAGVEVQPVRPTLEQGVPGFAAYGGYPTSPERRAELVGRQRYIVASDIMTNVSIVAASLRYFMNLLAKPQWKFVAADESDAAKQAAEFVQSVMEGTATNWSRIIRRSGMYRYHGFGVQEWIAMKRPDGMIGLKDIEPRPQHTITQWDIDPSGNVAGIVQTSPQTGQPLYLPRAKCIYLVDDMLTDHPEGLGWFRQLVDPAARMQEYLNLEQIGFQKDLSGIPVGRAPVAEFNKLIGTPKPGGGVYSKADIKQSVEGLVDFMSMERKGGKTSILLDSAAYTDKGADGSLSTSAVLKWGLDLLQGKAESLEEMGPAILRLTEEMARIMGTENMLTGNNSRGGGSQALSKDKSNNLYLTINGCLDDMGQVFRSDVVAQICALNGIPEEIRPKVQIEDVAFKDVEQVTQALADMAQAGATLQPDDPAIDQIRDLLGIDHQPEMTPERMAMLRPVPPALPGEKPQSPADAQAQAEADLNKAMGGN